MKVWPIFKKEIRLYFASPIGYAILFFFTVAMGFFFWVYFSQYTRMSMQAMMNPMAARDVNVIEWVLRPLFSGFLSIVLLLSLVPAISMRLIAEERKSQTLELLMTYPVSDTAILLGKFFAGLALYGCMLATSMVYLAILRYFTPLEWAAVGAMYGGLLLIPGDRVVCIVVDGEPDHRSARDVCAPVDPLGHRLGCRRHSRIDLGHLAACVG